MALGSRNKVSADFSMSSMTDLVFLLLIFFILISTLVTPFAVKMDVPSPSNNVVTNPEVKKVEVKITEDLVVLLDGKDVPMLELEQALMAKLGPELPEIKRNLLLSVDKTVPAGETVKVIVMARRNGWNLGLTGKE